MKYKIKRMKYKIKEMKLLKIGKVSNIIDVEVIYL